MGIEENGTGAEGAPGAAGAVPPRPRRVSRRQVLGQMSVAATAGAAAWVVPEILTARPVAAAVSPVPTGSSGGSGGAGSTPPPPPPPPPPAGSGVSTSPSTTGGSGGGAGAPAPSTASAHAAGASTTANGAVPAATSGALANTGDDLSRDAALGAALVAGGWAVQRWASRTPRVRPDETGRPGASAGPGQSS